VCVGQSGQATELGGMGESTDQETRRIAVCGTRTVQFRSLDSSGAQFSGEFASSHDGGARTPPLEAGGVSGRFFVWTYGETVTKCLTNSDGSESSSQTAGR